MTCLRSQNSSLTVNEEEKKIKLEELPDEGSSSHLRPTVKKKKNVSVEPRIKNLLALKESEKIEWMTKKWSFGEKMPNFGWVIILILLSFMQFSESYQRLIIDLGLGRNASFINVPLANPLIFAILLPFLFPLFRSNVESFTVSFDGIRTVQNVLPLGQQGDVTFVLIKWDEMTRVEKSFVGEKEILKIFSKDGHIGDIIWYIEIHKKRALLNLLRSLIRETHPLLVFLENEKELK
jgi:hypothetical protein